jgi:hypothetical protein
MHSTKNWLRKNSQPNDQVFFGRDITPGKVSEDDTAHGLDELRSAEFFAAAVPLMKRGISGAVTDRP